MLNRHRPARLPKNLGGERSERIVFHRVADLNRIAAHLAIFHVGLAADGEIEQHRDLLSAMRANEEVFHAR
jgi:hypothetical protein